MNEKEIKTNDKAIYLAGILAWLIPGAGHWYLGRKGRGGVIFVAITVTFLLGLLLGGIEMIDPQNAKAWFSAQILSGLPAILAALLQGANAGINDVYGRGVSFGQLYTGVAGLLNLLCIIDVLSPKSANINQKVMVNE